MILEEGQIASCDIEFMVSTIAMCVTANTKLFATTSEFHECDMIELN